MVKALIAAGAVVDPPAAGAVVDPPNDINNHNTPVFGAAESGDVGVLNLLLDAVKDEEKKKEIRENIKMKCNIEYTVLNILRKNLVNNK